MMAGPCEACRDEELPCLPDEPPDELSRFLVSLELSTRLHVDEESCGDWHPVEAKSRRIPFRVLESGAAWLHPDGGKPAGGTATLVRGCLDFGDQHKLLPLLDSLPPVIVLGGPGRPERAQIQGLVRLILTELTDRRPGFRACVNQLGHLLFLEAIRQAVAQRALRVGLLSGLLDPRLGPVLAAIHARPAGPWTVQQLAGLAAMSRSNFVARFRRKMGLPPMRYLALWRMSEARRLLRTTSQSMAAIAESTGYQSEPAFRKAFRAIVGVPPARYRSRSSLGMADLATGVSADPQRWSRKSGR